MAEFFATSSKALKTKSKSPDSETRCYTKLNVEKFKFTWIIDNFSYRQEKIGEALASSEFTNGSNELQWYLELYPSGRNDNFKDHLSLYLILASSNKPEVFANFKCTMVNEHNEKFITEHSDTWRFIEGTRRGYETFFKRDHLKVSGLLPDDKLVIHCEVYALGDSINVLEESRPSQIETPEHDLAEDFNTLFLNHTRSDLILSMLQIRKSALKLGNGALLVQQGLGLVQSLVENKDTSASVNAVGGQLLALANAFKLEELKATVENALSLTLDIENAAETLILADLNKADYLKAQVIEFIKDHYTEVKETQMYKAIEVFHPHLSVTPDLDDE